MSKTLAYDAPFGESNASLIQPYACRFGAERSLPKANPPCMTLLAQYSDNSHLGAGAIAAVAAIWLVFAIIGLLFFVLVVYCYYRIAERAGYNPWIALLAIVPGANLILLLIFAFSEWPIQRELAALRAQPGGMGPGGGPVGTTGAYGEASSGYLPGKGQGPITPA